MKTLIKALFALLFLVFAVSGALAAEKKNKPEIMTVDNYIAVFDFEVTTSDKGIARPLTESVRREIVLSGKYKVIDRGNMEKILGEQKLQMSGCVSGECIVEAGQLLGVGKLISGTVSVVGKTYYLTLSLISVKTGEIENVAEDKCKCEVDELLDSTKRLAKKLLGEKIEQPVIAAPIPAPVTILKQPEPVEVSIARIPEPEPKIVNSIGMTLVYIKPGTFMMGSPSGLFNSEADRNNDEKEHQVILTRGFYMQTTEVTQGQWRAVMGDNPSYFKNCGDDCPVEQISWNDAQEFIRELNQKESGSIYRLPTEAEWEYSARAGTTTPFNTGNCLSTDQANYDGDNPLPGCSKGEYRKTTVRTGTFSPNAWGLYDMHGNVWEWCQDLYGIYPSGRVTDPVGSLAGSYRVNRGGSWFNDAKYCRAALRYYYTPDYRYDALGLRLARDATNFPDPKRVPTTIAIIPSAVPAKEIARDSRFIVYENGTVLDTRTNLMWAAKDNGSNINWSNAKSYCENYRGGGHTDWRMPTQNEMAGLYDAAKIYKSDCGANVHLTELIRLTCIGLWASETRGSDAAYFHFYNSGRYWIPQSADGNFRALPVRSIK